MQIGDKYLIPEMKNEASKYISEKEINEENFWKIVENGIFFAPILKTKLDEFIKAHVELILNSESLCGISLTQDIVIYILQLEELQIKESVLLESVAEWALTMFGNDLNPKRMIPLLRHIRFSTLTIKEFCEFTDKYPWSLDAKDSLEILKHLQFRSRNLPEWCSPRCDKRGSFFLDPECNKTSRINNSTTTTIPDSWQIFIQHQQQQRLRRQFLVKKGTQRKYK